MTFIFCCSSVVFGRKIIIFYFRDKKSDICGRDDLVFVLHLSLSGKLDICGRDDFFFALYLSLGEKLDIGGRDDLVFVLHLSLSGKLDIGGRDDLFCSLLVFGRKIEHLLA